MQKHLNRKEEGRRGLFAIITGLPLGTLLVLLLVQKHLTFSVTTTEPKMEYHINRSLFIIQYGVVCFPPKTNLLFPLDQDSGICAAPNVMSVDTY
jgi:DUF438 domain-containing protein